MSVLIVEDDRTDCEQFLKIAEGRKDVEVIYYTNSSDSAIKFMRNQMPDGVILDLELIKGKGSGLQFLMDLKNLNLGQKPIVVVNTNTPSTVLHNTIRNMGVDFIFYKRQQGYAPESVFNTMLLLWETLYEVTDYAEEETYKDDAFFFGENSKGRSNQDYMSAQVNKELDYIGIGMQYVGRKYLLEAIQLILERGADASHSVLNDVARKYKVSYSSIIRSMQTAINNAWNNTDIDVLEKYYTARINVRSGVPSPTEFIYYYADKLRKAS